MTLSGNSPGKAFGSAAGAILSAENYYLHIHGEQKGPYTIPQITHLYRTGLIAAETLFWAEGMDQWQPVTELWRLPDPTGKMSPFSWLGAIVVLLVCAFFLLLQYFPHELLRLWEMSGAEGAVRKAIYILFFSQFLANLSDVNPPAAETPHPPEDLERSALGEWLSGWLTRLRVKNVAQVRRIMVTVIGGTVLFLGVLLIALPGPAVLVIPAGLAILATEYAWARRWLKKAKQLANQARGRKPAPEEPVAK